MNAVWFDIRETLNEQIWNINAKIIFHKSNRYYKRTASELVDVIKKFSDPIITESYGHKAEELFIIGFAGKALVKKKEK